MPKLKLKTLVGKSTTTVFAGLASPSFFSRLNSVSVYVLTFLIIFFGLAQKTYAAGSPAFEAALILPWNFVQQSLNSYTGSEVTRFELGSLMLEAQGIPVVVPSASVEMSLQLKPVIADGDKTHWETQKLQLKINLAGFNIQKTVEQVVGGVRVIATLQAQCAPFTLTQVNAQAQMTWQWLTGDQGLQARLADLQLAWPASSWQVGSLSCQGPTGFADYVQSELQAQLAQPDRVTPILKTYLERVLNEKMAQSLAQWKQPQTVQYENQPVTFQFAQAQAVDSKGILLMALIRLGGASEVQSEKIIPLSADMNLFQQVKDQPTLVMSKASVEAIVRHRSLWPKLTFSLNEFSAFQRVLQSRFIQFFVWPDLWNYSKSANFKLTSQLNGTPNISFSKDNSAWVSAPLYSWVTSQRDGRSWRYIELSSQVASWMNYSVSGGKLSLKFSEGKIKTTGGFGQDYVRAFNPNTYFPLSTIENSLNESRLEKTVSIDIPQIQIHENLRLRAKSLSRPSDGHFFMTWGK